MVAPVLAYNALRFSNPWLFRSNSLLALSPGFSRSLKCISPVSSALGARPSFGSSSSCLHCFSMQADVSVNDSASPPKKNSRQGTLLIGSGSAVPKSVISNEDLSRFIETNDEWISSRTGIRNRRILSGDETITDLAVSASRQALEMAKVDPLDINLIILCTSTPDDIFGGACKVQAALGCKNAVAFDLTAACSGFVLGLITASRFIQGGGFKNVLVIGADGLSRYVDWSDRGTCILFGDASGAVLLRATEDGENDGFLGFDMCSDGIGYKHLHAHISASEIRHETPNSHNGDGGDNNSFVAFKANPNFICMNGREVFRFAVKAVPQVVDKALLDAGMQVESVDWLVLHQANQRILDAVAERYNFPSERVISNLANYGNTSAASIPLALDESVRSGKIKDGNVLAIAGFGAGLTWASAIVRWR